VVITRNGRPEAVIISVADLETLEETLDLLSTPGALDEIRTAEAQIARGEAIGADELRRLAAERIRTCRLSLRATRRLPSHLPDGGAYPGPSTSYASITGPTYTGGGARIGGLGPPAPMSID